MATADELCEQGYDFLADGKPGEAVRTFEAALEKDPGLVDALHGLAGAQKDAGDLDAAIRTALRITEVAPDDPLGFTSLSIFYRENGQISEAEAASAQARMTQWKQELKEPD